MSCLPGCLSWQLALATLCSRLANWSVNTLAKNTCECTGRKQTHSGNYIPLEMSLITSLWRWRSSWLTGKRSYWSKGIWRSGAVDRSLVSMTRGTWQRCGTRGFFRIRTRHSLTCCRKKHKIANTRKKNYVFWLINVWMRSRGYQEIMDVFWGNTSKIWVKTCATILIL